MKRSARHPQGIAIAAVTASGAAWLLALLAVVGSDVSGRAQTPAYSQDESDYGYGNRNLTDAQRAGRDTWYFWTGGNEKFWVKMAELTEGNVNLLAYVDSRLHGRRFATLGAITQPGCRPATAPDQYGLWMDQCEQPVVPGVPGDPSGIVGLRRFPNPKFDKANWNAEAYFKHPGKTEPPYLIGMACGFCHVGFNPLYPPENTEAPKMVESCRRDRQPVLGGRPAVQPADAADRFPLARRQPAAAGDLGYVALRDRPHQQSKRDQLGLQPRVPADRAREDGGRDDAAGAPHPQGRCGFDWCRRRVASRLREHRHVLGLLADAARSGQRAQAAAAVQSSTTRERTARTGATPRRGWRTPRRSSRRSVRCT